MEKKSEHNAKLLMNLAKNGDDEAFGVIYAKYFTPIYRYILYGVKNRELAEDIAQTVFLKAFKIISGYRDKEKDPAAFFYTIAKNTIIDHQRKKKEYLYGDHDEFAANIPDDSTDPVKKIEHNEKMHDIMQCMQNLSEDQKEILTLKFICDFSNSEISDYTGKNEDAIRQLQCRALRSLRNMITKSNENR